MALNDICFDSRFVRVRDFEITFPRKKMQAGKELATNGKMLLRLLSQLGTRTFSAEHIVSSRVLVLQCWRERKTIICHQ